MNERGIVHVFPVIYIFITEVILTSISCCTSIDGYCSTVQGQLVIWYGNIDNSVATYNIKRHVRVEVGVEA